MKRKYKIVAIDFDETIYSNNNKCIIDGVEFAFRWFKNNDWKIILWTCRAGNRLKNAINILKKNDLYRYIDAVNENIEPCKYKTSNKILATLYIDDKNIGTTIDWYKFIEIMEKWR